MADVVTQEQIEAAYYDAIWLEAQRIATERRESLSDVVLRKALIRYIKKNGSK